MWKPAQMLSKLQRVCKRGRGSAWWLPLFCSCLLQSSSYSQFCNHGRSNQQRKVKSYLLTLSLVPTSHSIHKPKRQLLLQNVWFLSFLFLFNLIASLYHISDEIHLQIMEASTFTFDCFFLNRGTKTLNKWMHYVCKAGSPLLSSPSIVFFALGELNHWFQENLGMDSNC